MEPNCRNKLHQLYKGTKLAYHQDLKPANILIVIISHSSAKTNTAGNCKEISKWIWSFV